MVLGKVTKKGVIEGGVSVISQEFKEQVNKLIFAAHIKLQNKKPAKPHYGGRKR